MRWASLLALGSTLLTPFAAGLPIAFDLDEARGTTLAGDLVIELPGGVAFSMGGATRAEAQVVHGTLEVWTWTAREGSGPPLSDAEGEIRDLANATLTLRSDGWSAFVVQAIAGGRLGVSGRVDGHGEPTWASRDFDSSPANPFASAFEAYPYQVPTRPPVRWEEGWPLLGRSTSQLELVDGFPHPRQPSLSARGETIVWAGEGELHVSDAAGERTYRLGNTSVQPGVERWTRAFFRGELATSSFQLGEDWAAAGPSAHWSFEGLVRWDSVTGHLEVAGTRRALDGDALEIQGELGLVPSRGTALGAGGADGEGDATAVLVAGHAIRPPQRASAPAAVGVGLATLALLALAKGLLLHYSRLSADMLLANAGRRRIYEMLQAEPGLHVREVHRRSGLAYGAFRMHLAMLVNAGFVRQEKQGRYLLLHAAGSVGGRAIPNPVAKEVFASLPMDGAAIRARDLQAPLGLSRQLIEYHLQRLVADGHVVAEPLAPRGRAYRRAASSAPEGEGQGGTS